MLRFKRDDGTSYPEWEEKKIGDVFKIFKGAPLSKSDIADCGTPFILYGELYTTYKEVAKEIVRNTDKKVDKKYYSKVGDVIIPTSGETAEEISTATCVMCDGVILAGDLNVYRSIDVDGRFFSYLMNHPKKYDVARIAQGASVVHVQASEISKINIPVPTMEEQQKIVDFLSEVDNIILTSEQEIESLEIQKKGAMQKIFSQEVRFKADDGSEYPEWEEKVLSEVTERCIVGLAMSVTPYYRNSGIPILRNLNIKKNYLDDSDLLFLDEEYANSQDSKKIHTGDVLTVHTGYIGISCIVPEKYNECLTFTTLVTTVKNDILFNKFLTQFLNSEIGMNRIMMLTTTGGRNNLNTKDFIRLLVPLPCLEEQQKIADFLSEFDNAIEYTKEELEVWKKIKKGLLQQMFE